MNLIPIVVVFLHGKLVKVTSDVISGDTVSILHWIEIVGGCCCMCHLLRANIAFVKPLPAAKGGAV
jgi:hypothetical protein